MRIIIAALLLCALALPCRAEYIGRSGTSTWNIADSAKIMHAISWRQAESFRYDYLLNNAGITFDLSDTNTVIVWDVVAQSNIREQWIAATGSVINATNGHIRIEIAPEISNISNQYYFGFVRALQYTGTNISKQVTLVGQAITVGFSPDARYTAYHGPLSYAWAGEADPVWSSASNLYLLSTLAASLYATGSPLYGFTESDPAWTASSNNFYTRLQAEQKFATGTPIYVEADPTFTAAVAKAGAEMTGTLIVPVTNGVVLDGYAWAAYGTNFTGQLRQVYKYTGNRGGDVELRAPSSHADEGATLNLRAGSWTRSGGPSDGFKGGDVRAYLGDGSSTGRFLVLAPSGAEYFRVESTGATFSGSIKIGGSTRTNWPSQSRTNSTPGYQIQVGNGQTQTINTASDPYLYIELTNAIQAINIDESFIDPAIGGGFTLACLYTNRLDIVVTNSGSVLHWPGSLSNTVVEFEFTKRRGERIVRCAQYPE
ncbi:MAG: hypothetical protein V2A34_08930 [Lentisphaerota bacterium]